MRRLIEGQGSRRLVGVSKLESGGPLVLKKTLDSIMDVDDSALRSLTEALHNFRMKDATGENVGTVVSYLKGAMFLLKNCGANPTDVIGLLNDVMVSADCKEFTAYMKLIYFASKRDSLVTGYMEYLDVAEGGVYDSILQGQVDQGSRSRRIWICWQ